MAVIADLNKNGTTICMVTHDARYADMANIKLKLLDGQIVKDQPLKVAV
jgi:putative ABC transport system ATP-binding protein